MVAAQQSQNKPLISTFISLAKAIEILVKNIGKNKKINLRKITKTP